MTDKASLAKKFGMEVVGPLCNLFMQLKAETDWWLRELPVPVQEQIRRKKSRRETRGRDNMIRGHIAILERGRGKR